MDPLPRRRFLQSSAAVGLTVTTGRAFGAEGDSACSDGETTDEADVDLPKTAEWPAFRVLQILENLKPQTS